MKLDKEVILNKNSNSTNTLHKIKYRTEKAAKQKCASASRKQEVTTIRKAKSKGFWNYCRNCFSEEEIKQINRKADYTTYTCRKCGDEQKVKKFRRWECKECGTTNIM